MEEFEPSSDAWNRERKSSSQVRGLESEMEEFELRPTLRFGNGRVRAKFEAWNREWSSSIQVRGLESEMEEFEPSSRLGIGYGGVRD